MDICDELEAKWGTVHSGAFDAMRKAKREIERLRAEVARLKADTERHAERERLARASPDELMRLNGRMALCARILINGCKNAGTGYQALAEWDAARGLPNAVAPSVPKTNGSMQNNPTGIEAQVCADIARRQQLGLQKYGTTVADNPLNLRQWCQHAYEEALDMAVYMRRIIAQLDKMEDDQK